MNLDWVDFGDEKLISKAIAHAEKHGTGAESKQHIKNLLNIISSLNDKVQDEVWNSMGEDL